MATAEHGNMIALLEQQLEQGQRHFTLTEAATMTGLAVDDCRDALEELLAKYDCRLQVSEHGDLIYNFGDTLRRRGAKTFAERIQTVVQWLWKVFTYIYRVWITLTLVVYFVLFLVLLIVLVIAASARQGEERGRSSRSSMNLGGIFNLFFAIFRWRTITGSIGHARDPQGYRYRHYDPQPGVLNDQKKSFIAAVYDYVFGPPRVEIDPLHNEKEVAAYLTQHKGLVVAAELSALAGWNLSQAEAFLTECLIRYQGEVKVSDNGVLYGQFDDITRGVGDVETGEIEFYWNEYEAAYEMTGNSTMQNVLITFMNALNLVFSFIVLSGGLDALVAAGVANSALVSSLAANMSLFRLVMGWIPGVFSILFFLIPLGRLMKIQALRQRRTIQNIRKRLFKAIFGRQGQPQTVGDMITVVNQGAEEDALSTQVVEENVKELSLDMAGETLVSDAAEVQYAFPRITQELQDVQQLRQHRRSNDSLGDIIADSH